MSVRDDILELDEKRQELDDKSNRVPVKSEFVDGRNYPPAGFQPVSVHRVWPELGIDSPVWASSVQLWTDEDLRKRYEQALLTVESVFTRVSDNGTVEEVPLTPEEQARLNAVMNWFKAFSEIQHRVLEGAATDLQKKVTELQTKLTQSWDDLREVSEAFVPNSTELEN